MAVRSGSRSDLIGNVRLRQRERLVLRHGPRVRPPVRDGGSCRCLVGAVVEGRGVFLASPRLLSEAWSFGWLIAKMGQGRRGASNIHKNHKPLWDEHSTSTSFEVFQGVLETHSPGVRGTPGPGE